MKLFMEILDKNLLVRLEGELDHHNSREAREKIDNKYYNNNLLNIILDLQGLVFMDSSGIGLIMGRYKNCSELGGQLSIININPKIERILEMSGLTSITRVYSSVAEALKN